MNSLTVTIRNDTTEIPRLAELIEEFGEKNELPQKVVFYVNLALDELLTNVISYGYKDDQQHDITVDLKLEERVLTTLVWDDGEPFNPIIAQEPDVQLPIDERPVGGLGLLLVKRMMDQVEYHRIGDRNCLSLRKNLVT